MSQEQQRIRPDTPISSEAVIEQESMFGDMNSVLRKKMEEIYDIRDMLTKAQEENFKKQEELNRRELEMEKRERRLALQEEEMRKSLGTDFSGFRGFERTNPPVDSPVPLPITPSPSRPISLNTAPRRRTITPLSEEDSELKREIEDLRREIREMRTIAPFAPLPHLSQSSFKLRELIEQVPNFDGHNVPVTQFTRACRRALESLPANSSAEMETSLTRLLLSKLSGHAYLVIEGLRINKVECLIERLKDAFLPSRGSNYYRGQLATEFMRPGEHMLDYFSRIKELTQSILDETTESSVHVERRVELAIEREGLDALIRGLPRDYKTALKFEYFSNFDEILICLLKIDKQIKEEDSKMGILRTEGQVKDDKKGNVSPTFRNREANIRQIKESIVCEYCHKLGHKGDDCFRETVCNYCRKQGHPENRCFKRKRDNSNRSGRTSPNDSTSQTKTGYKSPKKCSYCRNLGHIIFDCRKLKYQLEKRNQGNGVRGTTDDARRSLTPKSRPRSPSPKAGPSKSNT
ncbi:hypothetical protein M0804_015308 [Polistes exclamans]|nr:hypothetical protein M0804_015308 [Polistes exclamans]